MSTLNGQSVIVTGASSGIGHATALALAEKGARVIAAARRKDRLEELAKAATSLPGEIIAYEVDVTDHAAMLKMGEETIKAFGQIDAIVNNAGLMPLSLFQSRKVDEWNRMVDVNIKGVLYGIDAVLTHMLERGTGHIVSVSSVAGHEARASTGVYAGTKFAVRAIMEGLRQEVAGKVRTTIICPGAVKTELPTTITDEAVIEAMMARFGNVTPMEGADIAAGIIYALEQPAQVSVNEIIIRPSNQG